MKFQTASRTYVGYACGNIEIWEGIKGKRVYGYVKMSMSYNVKQYILQQSPWFVVVGIGSSISQCSHVFHLSKANNTH